MDRDEAWRQALNIMLVASTQPDYQFTDDQYRTCGADGPDGPRVLTNGFVEVANALGVRSAETNPRQVTPQRSTV